ncbi:hypothetical protein M427DRAFT_46282 [Gonapodya prolifera JEL478]|uniref:Carbohydrate esterase family 4 protein n=1 Tax=Gonapodya prolifera (strain JEL478) TaxID=1344416 RepID=A0A139A815_GONPJ|nr:hypothetical protein M427DRAFT_46282 [Gonapodya prolifera JEL478]|eukprot:KXS12523.1 hypothetical protein M427DRAFT_46282 [Gonapodya prolifera JEL478]
MPIINSFRFTVFVCLTIGVYYLTSDSHSSHSGSHVRKKRAVVSSFDPQSYPQFCQTQGQIAVVFTEGPSKWTADVVTSLKTLKGVNASFFPVTTYLNDVANNVPLQLAAKAGYFIGQRWTTSVDPRSLSDDQIVSELLTECQRIQTYTSKVPKYIWMNYGQAVRRLGYVPLWWNLDTMDYNVTYNGSAASCNPIIKKYNDTFQLLPNGWGRYIAVERDLYQCTAVSVAGVFSTISAHNYTAVDMGTCLGDQNPYRTSCGTTSSSTTTASLAATESIAATEVQPTLTPTTSEGKSTAKGSQGYARHVPSLLITILLLAYVFIV